MANGVSGAFAGLYNDITILNQYGQVYTTWGEVTTGDYATIDVSREVNMGGNTMSINLDSGCVSNMNTCSFACNNGNTCGASGTYEMLGTGGQNCAYGVYDGNPSGGCQGFSNGGHVTVYLQ